MGQCQESEKEKGEEEERKRDVYDGKRENREKLTLAATEKSHTDA